MNREWARELWPIVRAFGEGKEVQLKRTDGWVALKDPLWNLHPTNYRINQAREFDVRVMGDGKIPSEADERAGYTGKIIKVREVLEGE